MEMPRCALQVHFSGGMGCPENDPWETHRSPGLQSLFSVSKSSLCLALLCFFQNGFGAAKGCVFQDMFGELKFKEGSY